MTRKASDKLRDENDVVHVVMKKETSKAWGITWCQLFFTTDQEVRPIDGAVYGRRSTRSPTCLACLGRLLRS